MCKLTGNTHACACDHRAVTEGHAPFRSSIENPQGRGAPHVITVELHTPRLKGVCACVCVLVCVCVCVRMY